MEALILTRAAFGALALPVGILLGAILGIVLLFYLFSLHWLLGVLFLALLGVLIWLYSRWEQRKFPGEPRP